MYLLHFDGMLRTLDDDHQLGGFLGYGWIVTVQGIEIAHGFGLYAHKRKVNSNIAEYLALIEGLEALLDLRVSNDEIEIYGDAKCVIDQMTGAASISSITTQKLYRRAQKLAGKFRKLSWGWVPRQKNKLADTLSRRGLRHLYIKPTAYETALNNLNTTGDTNGYIAVLDLRVYNLLQVS